MSFYYSDATSYSCRGKLCFSHCQTQVPPRLYRCRYYCPLVALPFTFRHPGSIHLVASNHHATPQIALTLLPMGKRSAGAAPDENEVKKQSRRSYHKFINRNTNCSSHHTEQPPIFEITVHSRCQYAAMLPRGPRRRDQPTWFKHEESKTPSLLWSLAECRNHTPHV